MHDLPDRQRLRDTWLERLETGYYEQGHVDLACRDHGGTWCFCALGAACEVFLDLGGFLLVEEEGDARIYNNERYFLPEIVRQAFGFRSYKGDRDPEGTHGSIVSLNDDVALSLPEIAALVRDNPAAYFVG
jgi:hypothetical protein